jgi:Fe-S cluster assembly ATP-binding protein
MSSNILKITGLKVEADGKLIIDGLDLTIRSGEIHVIMGPNGSGKSTLCYALMGHPKYKIIAGSVTFDGKDLLEMSTDQRARMGIFLGFQYPKEVPGITFGNFLRKASNLQTEKQASASEFIKTASAVLEAVKLDRKFIGRGLNEGFSGGEKKRAEIAQMAVIKPKIAILDEVDSGLDIDSLKITADNIAAQKEKLGLGLLLITHYQRLLDYLAADFVHIMVKGKLVKSGGKELVLELEKEGYKNYL